MKRLLLVCSLLLISFSANAAPRQIACRDCPFPFTLQCKADDSQPGSYLCQAVSRRKETPPIRGFHCFAAGGSDVPFPLRCVANQ